MHDDAKKEIEFAIPYYSSLHHPSLRW